MEKNLKNFITTVINTVDMDKETRKALLLNNSWIRKILRNIANYSRNNYPYPGYLDVIDTPNKIAIKIATDYINYVISSRTCGADMDIDICR